jgi:hypothetical protein
MPVVTGLTTTAPAGKPYYRITALSYRTSQPAHHRKVVSGEGAVKSRHGARYNHPGARAVYLAEDLHTCFAEKMFYFHREVLTAIDSSHITGVFPPFQQRYVLWEVMFQNPVPDVFELSLANASAVGVFPSLLLNPSQDYHHLKDRRAAIEHNGYKGLRAPSSRAWGPGHMVVLFEDQSKNVQRITPFEVAFRLITSGPSPSPFTNHAADLLDFTAGEVQLTPHPVAGNPQAGIGPYQAWAQVEFNH